MTLKTIYSIFLRKPQGIYASLLLASQAVIFVAPAFAQQNIVDERQEGFKTMGSAMKAINQQLKSDAPNTATMAESAQKMADQAVKISGWFPAGSGPESGIDTDALAYIWKNKEKFSRISDALIVDTKALVVATSGSDMNAIKKQLMMVKDNCSSCHDSFRAD